MQYSKFSLIGLCSITAVMSLSGISELRASTIYVLTSSENGPTALMASGLTTKSFWALGVGSTGDFFNSGNNAYSGQTGGDVTPALANVAYEKLSQVVVDEEGDKQGTPSRITGGQLVQLNSNQEFFSEIIVPDADSHNLGGAAPFDYTLSQNAPYYVRSFNPVPNLPGGTLVLNGRTTPTPVPTPEPAALSLMALAGLGLLLLPRRRRA